MFEKILIANRAEIACRIAATARRMGIRTVAVYSDADRHAPHVAACDEAISIGASPAHDSYLCSDAILQAAQASGAQAIHPGYGFLSENADFALACTQAGRVFIGPPAAAIQAMGLKSAAKTRMAQAGVPLLPGYHGADQDPARLQAEADRIGYPVLIKASAGGGGKGMRTVHHAADFAAALASCQREALHSFGDTAVLLETYLQRPRHIEVQIFGDTQGHYVHLFERDCSVQRRHQKVLEEAPAPGLSAALRQQMGQAALAAARAVHYVGAGTVEFIATQHGQGAMEFFFMEMNTRLQVEHPVTEAITGQDLVEWQLRIASGEPLPLRQDQLTLHGHAIEARICAEAPDNGFLPATGTLQVYRTPACVQFERGPVRIDSGVRQGDSITAHYDGLLAKLIVHGDTRAQALARLDAALADTHIVGLATNVQFLRRVARSPDFAQARPDTDLIPRAAASLFHQEDIGLPLAAAATVAHTLLAERATETADPFSATDGWRSHGGSTRLFAFAFGGKTVQAALHYGRNGALQLEVDGSRATLQYSPCGTGIALHYGTQRTLVHVYRKDAVAHIHTAQGATQIVVIDLLADAGAQPAESAENTASAAARLVAPMPGTLRAWMVQAGDTVTPGQALAVVEAMKMEHTLTAPRHGVVEALLSAPGEHVDEGAALLRLRPPEI